MRRDGGEYSRTRKKEKVAGGPPKGGRKRKKRDPPKEGSGFIIGPRKVDSLITRGEGILRYWGGRADERFVFTKKKRKAKTPPMGGKRESKGRRAHKEERGRTVSRRMYSAFSIRKFPFQGKKGNL